MTRRITLAGVAVLFLAAVPAHAADSQRARARVEAPPADNGEARVAVPREEARRAEPRPPAPAAEAAPKPTIDTSSPARSQPPRGPAVVTPTIITPTSIGGVTVGQAFSVGSAFTVGHDSAPVDPIPSPDRSRRHDRSRDDASKVETVFVPYAVPVPVYVPVVSATDDVVVPDAGVISEERPSSAVNTAASTRTRASRGYLTFSPWYHVGAGLEAGYPVPLPAPETFSEGNISSTVALTERSADDSAENVSVSVLAYARDVGGIAFMLQPADAAVYVDGRFVGSARDYAPEHEPLLLRFGVYTVELRAKGYVTERFPAYVTLGEVIPFSGSMRKSEIANDDRGQQTADRPAQPPRDDQPSRER